MKRAHPKCVDTQQGLLIYTLGRSGKPSWRRRPYAESRVATRNQPSLQAQGLVCMKKPTYHLGGHTDNLYGPVLRGNLSVPFPEDYGESRKIRQGIPDDASPGKGLVRVRLGTETSYT